MVCAFAGNFLYIDTGHLIQNSFTQIILPHAVLWKEIGILLNIDPGQLKEVKQSCSNDSIRCCKEMITKWLQSDKTASQEKLIASINLGKCNCKKTEYVACFAKSCHLHEPCQKNTISG